MDIFWQLLSNILIPGSLFALIAVGFTLIYSVTRVLHVAHGAVVIVAGYAFYAALAWFHWPVGLAVLFAVVCSGMLGWMMNRGIYERMRLYGVASVAGTLIATLSLMLILQNTLLAIFSSDTKTFNSLQGSLRTFGPVNVTDHEIRLVVISLVLIGLTYLFLHRTRLGKALRAVSDNAMVAEVVGISSQKMRDLIFVIGSVLAGVAGILFAIEYGLEPSMTTMVSVRMFFRAILGGVGSIGGAVFGSYSMETLFALVGWYINIAWVDLASFMLSFSVLVWRPEGILAKKKRLV